MAVGDDLTRWGSLYSIRCDRRPPGVILENVRDRGREIRERGVAAWAIGIGELYATVGVQGLVKNIEALLDLAD